MAAAGVWVTRPARIAEQPSPIRFTQEAPAGTTVLSSGVLSPDGKRLAFVAEDIQAGTTRLWVRDLSAADARALQGTENAVRPFWSPDSQSLGFIANSRLKTVSLWGGMPRSLATVRNNYSAGAAWGADRIIFGNWRVGLDAVSPSGGETTPLTNLDRTAAETAHQWPQFLPDGTHYLFAI
jgi:hypothetical protein